MLLFVSHSSRNHCTLLLLGYGQHKNGQNKLRTTHSGPELRFSYSFLLVPSLNCTRHLEIGFEMEIGPEPLGYRQKSSLNPSASAPKSSPNKSSRQKSSPNKSSRQKSSSNPG
ncbi:hypothetical protein WN55_00172 [Dufourea novaeangliae]|uniref:Uncharacterized protein n=1 Tax=Dufourea novaeangliae TaxID=178035 RepID=A0A154PE66_DUFNO|nr:hypothetical protein WN55_00172 [Dufourea novaeangliae]